MIKVKAPGKLYIAGEYAVVETGCPAILVGLNKYVYVSIEDSKDFGTIISKQYENSTVVWKRRSEHMVIDNRDNPFEYILSGIRITEQYAQELGKKMRCYDLKIDSELDSPSGKKYGLGSSAAVTVATVKALCQYYSLNVTLDQLFKLAAIAHFEVQGNGSLGDIATSVFGGWLEYHSFDRQWLKTARHNYSLSELLAKTWPGLKIKPLPAFDKLNLLIGWTGSPASTSNLVDKVELSKEERRKKYLEFVHESSKCVERMEASFQEHDLTGIQQCLRKNRKLLENLHEITGVEIETPKLNYLIESAEKFGGAAKTSGAGGGDCGIVLIDSSIDTTPLLDEWTKRDIIPLDLSVHYND